MLACLITDLTDPKVLSKLLFAQLCILWSHEVSISFVDFDKDHAQMK